MDETLREIDRRFYGEYRQKKFTGAEQAQDRAMEIACEVAADRRIETDGDDFDRMLQRAVKLGRTLRPLLNDAR